MASNNPPHAIVELTKEQYDFAIENCDVNILRGLAMLQALNGAPDPSEHRPLMEKLIALNENFKSLRDALRKAQV